LIKISGSPKSRYLEFLHAETGETIVREGFDLVVLGTGPIEVLPILSPLLKTEVFQLEDSQKYYGIAIRRKNQTNRDGINLSNLVCSPTIQRKKAHLQVYPGSAMAFGLSNSRLTSVFRSIANLFVIYVIYCDGSVSSKINARISGTKLELSKLSNPRTPGRLKVFLSCAPLLLKKGHIPLPLIVKAIPGHSQHFGATSYFSAKTGSFSSVVNENLQLQGHPDIMIADATSLRTIPHLPTTILSLINAVMALRKVLNSSRPLS